MCYKSEDEEEYFILKTIQFAVGRLKIDTEQVLGGAEWAAQARS